MLETDITVGPQRKDRERHWPRVTGVVLLFTGLAMVTLFLVFIAQPWAGASGGCGGG